MFLPINDIKSLCITDMDANKLCHDKHFWKNKMIKDNLPLLEVFMDDEDIKFIYDYVVERIKNPLSLRLISLDREKREFDTSISIVKLLSLRLINQLPQWQYKSMLIYHFFGDYYSIKMHKFKSEDYKTLSIKRKELIDFLIHVLYNYPTIDNWD